MPPEDPTPEPTDGLTLPHPAPIVAADEALRDRDAGEDLDDTY